MCEFVYIVECHWHDFYHRFGVFAEKEAAEVALRNYMDRTTCLNVRYMRDDTFRDFHRQRYSALTKEWYVDGLFYVTRTKLGEWED